jgi:phage/plasmid-associated DNA primase
VKQLTGGDTITACFKFKEYFEFRPQFKLWLATNHKPIIGGTDDGIWRRIRLVPFNVSFADCDDKQLSDKLRREAPGILRWMVDGLRQWRENGLMPPKEVLDATAQYRADEDLLMRFVADECEIGKGFAMPARALYDRYKDWARRNHEAEMSERKFADGMKEHGCKLKRFWLISTAWPSKAGHSRCWNSTQTPTGSPSPSVGSRIFPPWRTSKRVALPLTARSLSRCGAATATRPRP